MGVILSGLQGRMKCKQICTTVSLLSPRPIVLSSSAFQDCLHAATSLMVLKLLVCSRSSVELQRFSASVTPQDQSCVRASLLGEGTVAIQVDTQNMNNTDRHFYSAVSHRQGPAHHSLQDRQKGRHKT